MNYVEIGMRVRMFRRKKGLTQEELAEIVDISVPHMSHIETGNTKLSLPVFVALAEALDIRADDLLYDHPTATSGAALEEIARVLESCTAQQARCIADIAKAAKVAIDKNL